MRLAHPDPRNVEGCVLFEALFRRDVGGGEIGKVGEEETDILATAQISVSLPLLEQHEQLPDPPMRS